MTRNVLEASEALLNDPLFDLEGATILNDQDFVKLAHALDFSAEEWIRIFRAHNNGTPSESRRMFQQSLKDQLMTLPWCVYDDDPCSESGELSKRIEDLPDILKLAVLEAIERFWGGSVEASSFDERLQQLGLRPCESAHGRIVALAHRQHIFREYLPSPVVGDLI